MPQLYALMGALILGVIAFSFLVPVVPVLDCRNPGCGGPQYDSVTYYALGVGWYVTFVSPDVDAPYGWIALAAVVMFCIAVGYSVLPIFRIVRSSPASPQSRA